MSSVKRTSIDSPDISKERLAAHSSVWTNRSYHILQRRNSTFATLSSRTSSFLQRMPGWFEKLRYVYPIQSNMVITYFVGVKLQWVLWPNSSFLKFIYLHYYWVLKICSLYTRRIVVTVFDCTYIAASSSVLPSSIYLQFLSQQNDLSPFRIIRNTEYWLLNVSGKWCQNNNRNNNADDDNDNDDNILLLWLLHCCTDNDCMRMKITTICFCRGQQLPLGMGDTTVLRPHPCQKATAAENMTPQSPAGGETARSDKSPRKLWWRIGAPNNKNVITRMHATMLH